MKNLFKKKTCWNKWEAQSLWHPEAMELHIWLYNFATEYMNIFLGTNLQAPLLKKYSSNRARQKSY